MRAGLMQEYEEGGAAGGEEGEGDEEEEDDDGDGGQEFPEDDEEEEEDDEVSMSYPGSQCFAEDDAAVPDSCMDVEQQAAPAVHPAWKNDSCSMVQLVACILDHMQCWLIAKHQASMFIQIGHMPEH